MVSYATPGGGVGPHVDRRAHRLLGRRVPLRGPWRQRREASVGRATGGRERRSGGHGEREWSPHPASLLPPRAPGNGGCAPRWQPLCRSLPRARSSAG
ncbi:MAG TPA: hypothetical protein VN231_07865 [Allosphingosinicella sp.]|nr:hypothetical protein [Allosphingosinicella sp.]